MLFISPPFGNYLNFTNNPNILPIKGSFTLHSRPYNSSYFTYLGSLCGQFIRTFRYNFQHGGWVNKIGLRNRGIVYALSTYYKPYKEQHIPQKNIISVAIMDEKEIEEYDLIKQRFEDMSINCDLLEIGEELNDEMITTGKNFFLLLDKYQPYFFRIDLFLLSFHFQVQHEIHEQVLCVYVLAFV